jgi:hypothetical protein
MKKLIKRLFNLDKIEAYENELIGTYAELGATNLALVTERMLRRRLLDERVPVFGDWKPRKRGGYYRRVKYPQQLPAWRTETSDTIPHGNLCSCGACQSDATRAQMISMGMM